MKRFLKKAMPDRLLQPARALRQFISAAGKQYSFLDEQTVIQKYLTDLKNADRFCVDIAASDGVTMSNTLFLYKQGYSGIAVEYDARKFAALARRYQRFSDVQLVRTRVTPENIVALLDACYAPRQFDFLNFDIDSYDHFVLRSMLAKYRPKLLCVEINEKIPPPLSFTVSYDPQHFWREDHFYGQSIVRCYELCKKYRYEIVELHYNNLFLMPRELNPHPALDPEKAYDAGYRNKPDRRQRFPWNADMEPLLQMPKAEAIQFLREKFAKYAGKFELK